MTRNDVIAAVQVGMTLEPTVDEWWDVRCWFEEYRDVLVGWGQDVEALICAHAIRELDERFGFCPS